MPRQRCKDEELDRLLETAWKRQKWANQHPAPDGAIVPESKSAVFSLGRSDMAVLCLGAIVTLILYLEPQKSVIVIVLCLAVLAACVAYLLFHWFAKLPLIKNADRKRLRLIAACTVAGVLIALYGRHVWPKEDVTQRELQQILLGEEYDPATLSKKFPLGYTVFQLQYNDKLEFYKGMSLIKDYDFDWSSVKYISGTADSFEVQMPDIVMSNSRQRLEMMNNDIAGSKRVGWWMTFYSNGQFSAVGEVLDVTKDGVVFVVGLMPVQRH